MGRSFVEYDQYDGLGLAERIRSGEVSGTEVVEAAIDRIDAVNPLINAVIHPMYDEGRRALAGGLPPGPFQGVPFLLKDLIAAYAGVPMASGCRALKHHVPDFDSELVRRYKRSGVVVLGKTNTPEFGLMPYTEPEAFGPTRNPWDSARICGGSSGGSAAAVAAGMVPLASGGDGGGSIRIPSACCGLFGLKPTRGRTPSGPYEGEYWQGATVQHVITRSVRDSASMLDLTQGFDPGAPFKLAPPAQSYLKAMERPPQKLRIAYNTRSPIDSDVDPRCTAAVMETARILENLGHEPIDAEPPIDGSAYARSYAIMNFGEVAADLEELQALVGRRLTAADIETVTWTAGLLGRTFSAGDFVRCLRYWGRLGRTMGRFFETYDLYLTPTLACPPPKLGALQPKPLDRAAMKGVNTLRAGRLLKASGIVDKLAREGISFTPFTMLANMTGLPAMSVPLHWTPEGLPVGVQFFAPVGDETTLFRLAAQLEKAHPWFDKRPPLDR
ncbi:MAG: amidase family protein [Desulfobacterales bacterium]|jgi:amidase